VKEWWS